MEEAYAASEFLLNTSIQSIGGNVAQPIEVCQLEEYRPADNSILLDISNLNVILPSNHVEPTKQSIFEESEPNRPSEATTDGEFSLTFVNEDEPDKEKDETRNSATIIASITAERKEQEVENYEIAQDQTREEINNENIMITGNEVERKGRPKKGRKRKYENQSRESRKLRCETNQEYISQKGKVVKAREYKDFHCNDKCHEKVSTLKRQQEFQKFWNLNSYQAKCFYISSCVTVVPIKRKRSKKGPILDCIILLVSRFVPGCL